MDHADIGMFRRYFFEKGGFVYGISLKIKKCIQIGRKYGHLVDKLI